MIVHRLLGQSDQRVDRPDILLGQPGGFFNDIPLYGEVALFQHEVNHPLQPHAASVIGRKYLANAIPFDLGNFIRHDDPAAAAEHLDMPFATLSQKINNILEKFEMTSLIATDCDALSILLDSGRDNFLDRAIVTQVDHLCARGLQQTTDYVNRGIMTIKKTGGGNNTDLVLVFCRVQGRPRAWIPPSTDVMY